MKFDFSHLYRTENVDVKTPDGKVLFSAVVREITHGEKTVAQTQMVSEIQMPTGGSKKSRQRAIEQQMETLDKARIAAKTSLSEEVAAIVSWTLNDANGKPVPVCLEAWQALPAYLAQQIEEAIEKLSPELDDEFPSANGNGRADENGGKG